ncbi:acyl-coenzyme A thioesterase 3 [Hyalella azteca]|uniref:Acyl-coenzyme A thioesterase 3 n=1 Tax=Hyalella azteca TaxID=294128 RepID=A0A8B7NNE0_HYAAZ|nr:acyl-coenzyme A thioesterase 3 [Hyalella azteca]
MTSSPELTVTPQSCLMDESVTVKVTGLEKDSVYTLHTTASDSNGVPFFTVATYKSNTAGEIDLTKTPALGGHFRGVLPMAPFAQLLPVEQKALFPRFSYSDVTKPVQFVLSLYQGPIAVQLATIGAEKSGLKPYEDLQESMQTGFDIAYFDEAVQYLLSRQEVLKVGVGVIGSSKGGDLTLSMATNIPQVKAAVVVNGAICSVGSTTKLKDGTEKPTLPMDIAKIMLRRDNVMDMYYLTPNPADYPDAIIPVEEAYGDILWLCSMADRAFNNEVFAELAVKRCTENGKPDKVKVLKYPGAGHLLEPPNIPFCEMALQEIMKIGTMWGGNADEHCAAQEDSWKQVIAFYNEKLR